MTNAVEIDECSADSSDTSIASNSTDGSLITSRIIEEEERLVLENEESEREKVESDNLKTDEDVAREAEAELNERRYKRLLHLLNNSKMYSMILKDRIKEELNQQRKSKGTTSQQTKPESGNAKKPRNSMYKLGDILTEESIDQNVCSEDSKPTTEVDNEDYFKETRVTSLGFTVSSRQPELLEGAAMRDYQLKGLEWLKILFSNGVNGILADEMGLGKTIQVISFICYMIEQGIKGPFLIVAPLSTLGNWMAEFKRFAPKVPTMLYHGTQDERRDLLPKILKMSQVLNKAVHKVIITSYQVPLKERAVLGKINWYYLIIDEGQRIKNHNSQLSRALREFNTIGRLLLTGTPLQNDLSELWSLLHFLLPEVFNALDVFESWIDVKELESKGTSFVEEKRNVDVVTILQEILMPFLLRREKKDVDLQLPPKKEVLIYCPMTARQKDLYQRTLDRSIEQLIKPKENIDIYSPLPKRRCFLNSPYGKKGSSRGKESSDDSSEGRVTPEVEEEEEEAERFVVDVKMQNPQMQLRKAVNHPYLIQFPLKTGTEELRIDEDLVKESGKMLVLDALLSRLKARGHKVLVFSSFKIMLDILEDHALMRGYRYCRLDGGLKMDDRNEEIQKFMNDPDIFVFYITVRAGGLGINLVAADTVIFYDSDWNPQINLQSQDRCHRIGQVKPVVVYRLCTKGTVDETIIERGNAKRRLEKMILQKGRYTYNSKKSKKLDVYDLKELKLLLESTDHDIVFNSNGFVLNDAELDALLDRSDITNDGPATEEKKKKEQNDEKPESKLFKVIE